MSVTVRVEPGSIELSVGVGERVIDVCEGRPDVPLSLACRAASCGICRVAVEAGATLLEPPSKTEGMVLQALHATSDERLGCQLRIDANAVPPSSSAPVVRLRVITPTPPRAAARS